ncbi:MAG: diaminopimelate epimerase, partial [Spirochaetota bacterium]
MARHFTKYQALGNDYLVVEAGLFGADPDPEAVRAICDRNRGPGSDGILLGGRTAGGILELRIFNPDGSEAEKSGNGLRIFARHIFETTASHPREFPIMTRGGEGFASILADDGSIVRVDMGVPDFSTGRIGDGRETVDQDAVFGGAKCRITCVSMGNPHCVVTGLAVDATTARRVGPLVENAPRFPKRTNVQFLEVLSRASIRIEIWERGAGYTLASGSSSC